MNDAQWYHWTIIGLLVVLILFKVLNYIRNALGVRSRTAKPPEEDTLDDNEDGDDECSQYSS